MHKSLVASGLAVALAANGCGEKFPHSELPGHVRQEISYIVNDLHAPQSLANFSKLKPARYNQVAKFSVHAAGVEYNGFTYSDQAVPYPDTATQLYSAVQGHMIDVVRAISSHAINLPVYNQGDNRYQGQTKSSLKPIKQPSVLVLTGKNEMSTIASQRTGVPSAVTFTPVNFPKLTDSISFIAPSGSRFWDADSVATEACNSKVDIETDNPANKNAAQEVICNSFGLAYAKALNGYSYAQYNQAADTNNNVMGTSNGHWIPFFILPETAYQQILENQSPTALTGVRSENGRNG